MVEPTIHDPHQRLFVDIAEEDRIDDLHNLLPQDPIDQFQSIVLQHLDDRILSRVVFDSYLEIHSTETQDLCQKINQFVSVLFKNGREPKENTEILLVFQHTGCELPFLLFSEVAVRTNVLDMFGRTDGQKVPVTFWEFHLSHPQVCRPDSFQHLFDVLVDQIVLKTGSSLEISPPFLDSGDLIPEHQVGLPACSPLIFIRRQVKLRIKPSAFFSLGPRLTTPGIGLHRFLSSIQETNKYVIVQTTLSIYKKVVGLF